MKTLDELTRCDRCMRKHILYYVGEHKLCVGCAELWAKIRWSTTKRNHFYLFVPTRKFKQGEEVWDIESDDAGYFFEEGIDCYHVLVGEQVKQYPKINIYPMGE